MNDPSMTQETAEPALPPPPRPLTARARRRAWGEPRVRFWWLAGVVLLLIAGYILVREVHYWRVENWLIREGTVVQAEVKRGGAISVPGQRVPPDTRVVLEFEHAGAEYTVRGTLGGWDEFIVTGSMVPIRIDPNRPTVWTARTQPTMLGRELFVGAILLPVAALLAAIGAVMRWRVLRVWQSGEAREAAVVDGRQTAIAPLSRAVRCTLREGSDKRLLTVFIPQRLGNPQPGESLWLVVPPGRPTSALAARVFYESK